MTDGRLTLGMVATSTKENEKRVAIHPAHFPNFDPETRAQLYAEKGYGKNFRISDAEIAPHVAGLMTRAELFANCDAVMVFKPTEEDFPLFREGQVLWGAVHAIQNPAIVDEGIRKRMTYIAMEYMYQWHGDKKGAWLFNTQSEMAGYCSVIHCLQVLLGTKGWYDQPKKCAIISFGAVGRGAVHALEALDYHDISVFSMRPPFAVAATIPGVTYRQYFRRPDIGPNLYVEDAAGEVIPFGEELADYDVIVNAVYQDTDNPLMFIYDREVDRYKSGTIVIDVSCDRGMGFEWARPTRFDDPMFEVGGKVLYYAVDHSPSFLFNTASLEHSKPAWPWVKHVVGGPKVWAEQPTVGRAMDLDRGVIVNPKILTYQDREPEYPHRRRS